MDLGLKGKRTLVLASSRGLGFGVAKALAMEGADVLLAGRTESDLEKNAEIIRDKGDGQANYVVADLADPNVVTTLAEAARSYLGGLDVLVNNTGGPPPGRMVDADLAVAWKQMEMMVMRVAEITHHFLPGMREQRWGRVITLASSGIIQPIPNLGISNMVRSALVGWSKSLANDVGADGVTVNILAPGRIHTDRVDQIDEAAAKRMGGTLEDAREASYATIPVGRYGSVQEFGAVAAFLASEQAGYITGSIIRCDGGQIKSV